jgi:hypothetical protein
MDVLVRRSSLPDEGTSLFPAVLARLSEIEDELRAVRQQLKTKDGSVEVHVDLLSQVIVL